MRDVELPEEIDLSGSGNLYQFIPLRLFTETRHLNLSSTSISNRHFQQIATVAKNLERLDISHRKLFEIPSWGKKGENM